MNVMAVRETLEQVLESEVERLGFELVDLERAGHRARPVLRLRIDRPGAEPGAGVTVDECAGVSRQLEEMLDERDDLPETYILEVSSPGLERPIRKRRDFERYVGREVALRGYAPLVGRGKRIEGVLLGLAGDDDERIRLRLADGVEVEVPRDDVAKAQLVVRWDEYRFDEGQ